MSGFPIYRSYEGVVGSKGNIGVLERYETTVFGIFSGELDVGINGVDALVELVTMFCPWDNEGVIYLPKAEPGWMAGRADGFCFKLFHEHISN